MSLLSLCAKDIGVRLCTFRLSRGFSTTNSDSSSESNSRSAFKSKIIENIVKHGEILEVKMQASVQRTFTPLNESSKVNDDKTSEGGAMFGSKLVAAVYSTEELISRYFFPFLPSETVGKPGSISFQLRRRKEMNAVLRTEANKINSMVRSGANVQALDFLLDNVVDNHASFSPKVLRGVAEPQTPPILLHTISYYRGEICRVKPIV